MFHLPPLPYDYNDLEPYIDEMTMHCHHDKHHRTYVDHLNESLKEFPKYENHTLTELIREQDHLPSKLRLSVVRNGGGHYNHSLFWKVLRPVATNANPDPNPKGALGHALERDFGSYENFQLQFVEKAKAHFGSGWAWLSADDRFDEKGSRQRKLLIHTTLEHETPLNRGLFPLFVVDLWEHAYYLHYQNRREEFLGALWNIVNWEEVAYRFTNGEKSLRNAA